MSEPTLCPWCHTEIIWDEEIGPEAFCPHCDNELSDYRTLHIAGEAEESADAPGEEELSLIEEQIAAEGLDDERYEAYEEQVRRYLEQQDERIACIHCGEEMICTGTHTVKKDDFDPKMPRKPQKAPKSSATLRLLGQPFLSPPFTVDVYICPACFQMKWMLSEEDRMKLIDQHQN